MFGRVLEYQVGTLQGGTVMRGYKKQSRRRPRAPVFERPHVLLRILLVRHRLAYDVQREGEEGGPVLKKINQSKKQIKHAFVLLV